MNKNKLIKLRQKYDQAVVDSKTSAKTAERYSLWKNVTFDILGITDWKWALKVLPLF